MHYLLDTTWVIFGLINERAAVDLIDTLMADGVAVSMVTSMEAYQGTLRETTSEAERAAFARFFATVPILPFSAPVARRCAELRHQLKQQGKRVNSRAMDLIIAATALDYGLELVTRNTSDDDDVPGLTVYRR